MFGSGPRLDEPQGDAGRQAVAALRGYAYQLYVSGLAWLGLADGEHLHLEVAEDFAVATRDALAGTQVKDTAASGSVTLQSAGARAAIDSYVDLVLRNPGRRVTLHYLTTSEMGIERRTAHRPAGEVGLRYWRRAAAGADVGPLRTLLMELDLKPGTHQHIAALPDDALRRDLLARIHWTCGAPGLADVRADLLAGLVELAAATRRLSSRTARSLLPVVLERLLMTAVSENRRLLRRADLLELIDSASLVAVPLERLAAGPGGDAGGFGRPTLLVPIDDLPLPGTMAPRPALVAALQGQRIATGLAVACGATGLGKSLAARQAAAAAGGAWAVADFRNLGSADTAVRLDLLLGELAAQPATSVILDDLNEADDPAVRDLLVRLLAALRRRDATALVTSYLSPAPSTLQRLSTGTLPVEVPYLSEAEVADLVERSGGDARYADLVFRAASRGHPQLTMAVLHDLAAAGWSRAGLARTLGGEHGGGLSAERHAVRNRLVATAPVDAQQLLFRASLVSGPFDRDLVMAIAGEPPQIASAGLVLDRLVGPWLEPSGRSRLRVSPLLEDAAEAVFSPAERQGLHRCVARAMMTRADLSVLDAGMVMRHALGSGDGGLVAGFAQSVVSCSAETLDVLAPFLGELQRLPTDTPIFPQDLAASAMMRLAQLLSLLPNGSPEAARRCLEAVERERVHVRGRRLFEALILSKTLLHPRAGELLPDWVELVLRFDALGEADAMIAAANASFNSRAGGDPHASGVFLAAQMRNIRTVRQFRTLVERLDREPEGTRMRLLSSFQPGRGDISILVNHGGMIEARTEPFDWEAAAADYAACADIAHQWPNAMLASRCAIARAICYDENGGDPDRALACLDDAEQRFGTDIAIARARAKTLWRRNDHAAALPLLTAAAEDRGQDRLEQAYIAREAGICSAELGDWQAAWRWFERAHETASGIDLPAVRAMAVGLLADTAHAACRAGRPDIAIGKLRDAIAGLTSVDEDGTIQEAHCHRLVRHATLWLFKETTGRLSDEAEVPFAPGCASNPDPHRDIRSHPTIDLDLTYYFLTEIDEGLPEPTGFYTDFRSHLVGGPILSSEITLAIKQDRDAIVRHDARGFVTRIRRHASMAAIVGAGRGVDRGEDLKRPIRGDIPLATIGNDAPAAVRLGAEDFLLSFAIAAALDGAFDAVDEAVQACLASSELSALRPLLERLQGTETRLGSDRDGAAITVGALRGADLTGRVPEFLWSGIWLLLHLRVSKLRDGVAQPVVAWIFEGWTRLLATARFRLTLPQLSAPPIEAVIARPERSPAAAARLVLAAAPAAGTVLPDMVRTCLEEVAAESA